MTDEQQTETDEPREALGPNGTGEASDAGEKTPTLEGLEFEEGAREPPPPAAKGELGDIEDGPTEVVDYDPERRRGRRRYVRETEEEDGEEEEEEEEEEREEDLGETEPRVVEPKRRLAQTLQWGAFVLVNLAALGALIYFLWRVFGPNSAPSP